MERTYIENNILLDKAICLAVERHSGQVRKGSATPYIVHPLETMSILVSAKAETTLLIAGVLHDTVEDTDTTLEEIADLFGNDVAELVSYNSEDKSKSWDERKKHTIDSLKNAPFNVKLLAASDKLSNLRSIAADYKAVGEDFWKRFNAPKEKQAWYYSGLCASLSDLANHSETRPMYSELLALYNEVFG